MVCCYIMYLYPLLKQKFTTNATYQIALAAYKHKFN